MVLTSVSATDSDLTLTFATLIFWSGFFRPEQTMMTILCVKYQQAEVKKGSGFCDNFEAKEEGKINGLLYLPALGLFISSFTMLYNNVSIASLIPGAWQKQGVINIFSVLQLAVSIIDIPLTVLVC